MSSYPVRKQTSTVSSSLAQNEAELRPYQIMTMRHSESEDDKAFHIEREESRKGQYTRQIMNKIPAQKESYRGSMPISRSNGDDCLASLAEMPTDQKRGTSYEPPNHSSRPYKPTSSYSLSAITDGNHPYPSSLSGSQGSPFALVNSTSRRRDSREFGPEQPINRTARTISTSLPSQGDESSPLPFKLETSPEKQTGSIILSKGLQACADEESRTDNRLKNNVNIQCHRIFDIRSTPLQKENAIGPFRECYSAFYNEFTGEILDYEAFACLEQLVVFLESSRYELGSLITSVLPSLIKIICEKIPEFDWPFIQNYNFNGDNFYGPVNPSKLLADLDAGLGVRITNPYRTALDSSYTDNLTVVETNIDEANPQSEKEPVANLRYAVLDHDEEEEAKEFLNFLAELDEDEEANEDGNTDVTTDGSEYEGGKIIKRSILNKDSDGAKQPMKDGTESDSSFEEVEYECSDVESVCTTSSESGWAHVSKSHSS